MLTLLHSAVDNPGVFVPRTPAPTDQSTYAVLIVTGLILLVVAILHVRIGSGGARNPIVFTVCAAVFIACGVGGIWAAQDSDRLAQLKAAHDGAAHLSDVTDWLVDDYGIAADPVMASRLTRGEAFVTDYAGQEMSVAVRETTSGDLALINAETGAPLPHLPRP